MAAVFTGIVEELGRLRRADAADGSTRMVFEATAVLDGTRTGDSMAVNGCCLTVIDTGHGWWAADVVDETLRCSTLGALRAGDAVNLERPVRLADRLGGHLVQGHVDGVGILLHPAPDLRVQVPADLVRYLVPKGSVTVEGCSLTVVDVSDDSFSVAIIPHTAEVTVLGRRAVGDGVNLEVDVIAKYTERLLAAGAGSPYAHAAATVQRPAPGPVR